MTDLTVIRGYVAICKRMADDRLAELDACVDALERARDAFDVAHEAAVAKRDEAERALEYAERLARFAAQAMAGDCDPQNVAEAAAAIRALVGITEDKAA